MEGARAAQSSTPAALRRPAIRPVPAAPHTAAAPRTALLTRPRPALARAAAYTELATLSSYDFLGKDGDKWVGWGGMPKSVKALYNRQGTKGLLYQGMDKTSDPKTK